MAKKRCASADDSKKCMIEKITKCKKMVKNPCAQAVAKKCKTDETPKKCFFENIKECKKDKATKEDEELEELRGNMN